MSKLLIIIGLLIGSLSLSATPASEASVKELLRVTDVRKTLDAVWPQLDHMMQQSMQQATGGKAVTPEQQKYVDSARTKILSIYKEELSWEKMEPVYVTVYQQSLTQEEIDGIIAFYKTPAGEAFIKKMPLILQNTFAVMQQRMGPIMTKIRAVMQETTQEIKKDKEQKG
jgi:hypothetical protein